MFYHDSCRFQGTQFDATTSSDEDELPRSDEEIGISSIASSNKKAFSSETMRSKESHESSRKAHPLAPKSSFVKSCARFPLLHESAINMQKEGTASEISSKQLSAVAKPSAPKRKKAAESLKDRLFRSLKTLKKNSDPSSPSSSSASSARSLGHTRPPVPVPKSKELKTPLPRSTDSPSNSTTSAGSSPVPPPAHKAIVDPAFDAETDEETEEERDNETIEAMDTNDLTDSDVSFPVLHAHSERQEDRP